MAKTISIPHEWTVKAKPSSSASSPSLSGTVTTSSTTTGGSLGSWITTATVTPTTMTFTAASEEDKKESKQAQRKLARIKRKLKACNNGQEMRECITGLVEVAMALAKLNKKIVGV